MKTVEQNESGPVQSEKADRWVSGCQQSMVENICGKNTSKCASF